MDLKALIRRLFPSKPDMTVAQVREGMSRRRFLGMAGGAAIGVAVAPELFELLKPSSIIALPDVASFVEVAPITMMRGNQLLTLSMITNQSLKVLENELRICERVNRRYDPAFAGGGGYTVNIRRPPRYASVSTIIDTL